MSGVLHLSMPPVRPVLIAVSRAHGNCKSVRHAIDPNSPHLTVKGKRVYFEFDPRFGPTVLDAHGEVAKRQPGETSVEFWWAFEAWLAEWTSARPAIQFRAELVSA